MRLQVEIPDELYGLVKTKAAQEGASLTSVVRRLLADYSETRRTDASPTTKTVHPEARISGTAMDYKGPVKDVTSAAITGTSADLARARAKAQQEARDDILRKMKK